MRVLLSAYACHPGQGSEPGVGWEWLKELSKRNEVWVICYSGDGQDDALEESIALLDQAPNIRLCLLGVPRILKTRFFRLRYEIWQWHAYRYARSIQHSVKFDLIHHVTIAAWWNCGYLWKLRVPFVFGPIAGVQKVPFKGFAFLPACSIPYELLRTITLLAALQLWRRPRKAVRASMAVLPANRETGIWVDGVRGGGRATYMSEVGVSDDFERTITSRSKSAEGPVRLLFVGRLVPRKNFELLIRAVKKLPENIRWELQVAGDGPLLDRYRSRVRDLGLNHAVNFLGSIHHSEVSALYQGADIFVFPSLRDATGTVVVEAMSVGLPVIALNLHGASVLLRDGRGIVVDINRPAEMVREFAGAIELLALDSELRSSIGAAAKKWVISELSWAHRGTTMQNIYKKAVVGWKNQARS